MTSQPERSARSKHEGPVRGPQSLAGGVALAALALLALYLTSDLPQGTLRAMGPAMLPRWLAIVIAVCGIALAAAGFLKEGDRIERSALRGPVFVVLGVLAFALTIRPFTIGSLTTPGLGLIVAGPLAMLVAGHATPEVRLRELVIMALALTAFCMVLFGDLLNLPIPVFPQSLTQLFPADWSQKQVLRATAAVLAAVAALIYFSTRRRGPAPVDVADHSGRI